MGGGEGSADKDALRDRTTSGCGAAVEDEGLLLVSKAGSMSAARYGDGGFISSASAVMVTGAGLDCDFLRPVDFVLRVPLGAGVVYTGE